MHIQAAAAAERPLVVSIGQQTITIGPSHWITALPPRPPPTGTGEQKHISMQFIRLTLVDWLNGWWDGWMDGRTDGRAD